MPLYAHTTVEQAKAADLLRLVEPDTTLRKIANTNGGEYAGPCPFCGGADRFHVQPRPGRWVCRQCTPKWQDAIAYVMRRQRLTFPEAVAHLTDHQAPAPTPPQVAPPGYARPSAEPNWRLPAWQLAARLLVDQAQAALAAPHGAVGRDYLTGRGIAPATWTAWGLGLRWVRHVALARELPALTLPWHSAAGEVMAVQYRYIAPNLAKRDRFAQKPGGERVLFGRPLLADRGTLILCEGELNAVALWQVAHAWADVLSFGAQDALPADGATAPNWRQGQLLVELQKVALPYGRVIVWADEQPRAVHAAQRIAADRGRALWSVDGRDANDHLVADTLAAVLAAGR